MSMFIKTNRTKMSAVDKKEEEGVEEPLDLVNVKWLEERGCSLVFLNEQQICQLERKHYFYRGWIPFGEHQHQHQGQQKQWEDQKNNVINNFSIINVSNVKISKSTSSNIGWNSIESLPEW